MQPNPQAHGSICTVVRRLVHYCIAMKFARLLRATAADMPEMSCLLACYKSLKKLVKLLPSAVDNAAAESALSGCGHDEQRAASAPAAQHAEGTTSKAADDNMELSFERALCVHLQEFNGSWVDREETCVIRLQCMLDQVRSCTPLPQGGTLRAAQLVPHRATAAGILVALSACMHCVPSGPNTCQQASLAPSQDQCLEHTHPNPLR